MPLVFWGKARDKIRKEESSTKLDNAKVDTALKNIRNSFKYE